MSEVAKNIYHESADQICGFKLGNGYFAVPVLDVQEVVKPQKITIVPKSPDYIDGLINLRGQVVTAINLRSLFKMNDEAPKDYMNIIVKTSDALYSLVVDEIMDVLDVDAKTFEKTPSTLGESLKEYVDGVYKLDDKLLTLVSLDKLLKFED